MYYLPQYFGRGGGSEANSVCRHDKKLNSEELTLLSAFGASAITRLCSRRAFEKKGRSMQASDLGEEVSGAFAKLFESEAVSGELFEGGEGGLEAKL